MVLSFNVCEREQLSALKGPFTYFRQMKISFTNKGGKKEEGSSENNLKV